MLNYIWGFMILVGIVYAAFTGNMKEVTDAALDSAGEAVSLCITMAGITALWVGLMKVAESAGIIQKLTIGISPFLRFMFPRIPKGHASLEYIATNIISNILGLGWACTPAGLKAMEELAKLEEQRGIEGYQKNKKENILQKTERKASNEMCVFLILNISSLQIIPVNMIAYRSQYGSSNPSMIIGPAILATLISTIVAIIYCKIWDKRKEK